MVMRSTGMSVEPERRWKKGRSMQMLSPFSGGVVCESSNRKRRTGGITGCERATSNGIGKQFIRTGLVSSEGGEARRGNRGVSGVAPAGGGEWGCVEQSGGGIEDD